MRLFKRDSRESPAGALGAPGEGETGWMSAPASAGSCSSSFVLTVPAFLLVYQSQVCGERPRLPGDGVSLRRHVARTRRSWSAMIGWPWLGQVEPFGPSCPGRWSSDALPGRGHPGRPQWPASVFDTRRGLPSPAITSSLPTLTLAGAGYRHSGPIRGHRGPEGWCGPSVPMAGVVRRWSTLTTPGTWAWHCHILSHAERGDGMFGMVTALVLSRW